MCKKQMRAVYVHEKIIKMCGESGSPWNTRARERIKKNGRIFLLHSKVCHAVLHDDAPLSSSSSPTAERKCHWVRSFCCCWFILNWNHFSSVRHSWREKQMFNLFLIRFPLLLFFLHIQWASPSPQITLKLLRSLDGVYFCFFLKICRKRRIFVLVILDST